MLTMVLSKHVGAAVGPEPQSIDELKGLPQLIQQLLAAHKGILEMPTHLPPQRAFDHRICLKDERQPINMLPYQYT